jgi:hypothetical protein
MMEIPGIENPIPVLTVGRRLSGNAFATSQKSCTV